MLLIDLYNLAKYISLSYNFLLKNIHCVACMPVVTHGLVYCFARRQLHPLELLLPQLEQKKYFVVLVLK